MTDYWRFGPWERMTILTVLALQWCLFMLVTLTVLSAHGDPTPSDARVFELAFWVMLTGLAFALVGVPVIRALPDGYRYAKDKLGGST
jgi:hypothetical protein